jgi:hypothetical protein
MTGLGFFPNVRQDHPGPVISTLRYWRDEYEAHVRGHVCRPVLVGAATA